MTKLSNLDLQLVNVRKVMAKMNLNHGEDLPMKLCSAFNVIDISVLNFASKSAIISPASKAYYKVYKDRV